MSKKVLVISASLRGGSNSEALAKAFAEGAREAGSEVEEISLRGKKLEFCLGCLSCQETGKCVIRDDADEIAHKMQQADVIAFATPIYYYELSGQLKTLLDRANPLFPQEYAFRDIYLLTASADESETAAERAVHGLGGWIACFEKARLAGAINAGGVNAPGEIKGHPALRKAAEMGRKA